MCISRASRAAGAACCIRRRSRSFSFLDCVRSGFSPPIDRVYHTLPRTFNNLSTPFHFVAIHCCLLLCSGFRLLSRFSSLFLSFTIPARRYYRPPLGSARRVLSSPRPPNPYSLCYSRALGRDPRPSSSHHRDDLNPVEPDHAVPRTFISHTSHPSIHDRITHDIYIYIHYFTCMPHTHRILTYILHMPARYRWLVLRRTHHILRYYCYCYCYCYLTASMAWPRLIVSPTSHLPLSSIIAHPPPSLSRLFFACILPHTYCFFFTPPLSPIVPAPVPRGVQRQCAARGPCARCSPFLRP